MEMGFYKDVVPFIAMVAIECTDVGSNILYKAAILKGMSNTVYVVCTYALAALILLPCLFIFRSRTELPTTKLRPLISKICLLGVMGSLARLCGNKGVELSSPTLASAISSLTPAFTFIVAVLFRMERLNLRSSSTQSKIVGTIVSISGALVVVLYKGPTILSPSSPKKSISLSWPLRSSQSDWMTGGVLLTAQYLLYTFWYILQTEIMRMYPAELVVACFYNFCVAIASAPICFITEEDWSDWRIGLGIPLVSIMYTAIFVAIGSTVVHSWGLHLKGPLYIAMFKPLSIAIAAAMSGIFLGDTLHLGSVVGAIIVTIGFYAVIWGKAKEENDDNRGFTSREASSSSDKIPLLHCLKDEENCMQTDDIRKSTLL